MKHDMTAMSVTTLFWYYKSDDGYFQWAGSIVEYEITGGHRISPLGTIVKGNDLEEDR